MRQIERISKIRAEMAEQARDRVERLHLASLESTIPDTPQRARRSGAAVLADAISTRIDRDPCGFCGVRGDKHAEFGCKRWRAR